MSQNGGEQAAMYRLLDRYILRETTGPLVLGLLVFTFLALMQELFQYAEMIIGRNVEAAVALQLLAYSLPHIVVLTIPMAFLFAILIAIGRLAADSELVAMRASGISLWAIYRPILLLSLVLTGLTGYLTTVTLPAGNKAISDLRLSILTRNVSQQVKPRVFYDQLQDRVLYVFDAPENEDGWRGVFLADAVPGPEQQVIVGETGEINLNPGHRPGGPALRPSPTYTKWTRTTLAPIACRDSGKPTSRSRTAFSGMRNAWCWPRTCAP